MVCSTSGANAPHVACGLNPRPCIRFPSIRHVKQTAVSMQKHARLLPPALCTRTCRIFRMPGSRYLTKTYCSATSTMVVEAEQLQQYQELMKWAKQHGALEAPGKMQLQCSPSGERGLFATAPIEANDLLLVIPLSLALTDHDPQPCSSLNEAFWGLKLAARVLQEQNKGPSSLWAPYIAMLPAHVPAPLETCSWEAIKAVEVPTMMADIHKWVWTATTCQAGHPEEAFGGLGQKQVTWAMSVVHSRTFGNAGPDGRVAVRMLVPIVDMLNHAGDQYTLVHTTTTESATRKETRAGKETVGETTGEEAAGEETTGETTGKTSKEMTGESGSKAAPQHTHLTPNEQPTAKSTTKVVIVPGDNVTWDIVGPSKAMTGDWELQLSATRDIAVGEELLVSYGARDNDDFFLYYGFVPPRNPHDGVVLFQDLEDAAEWFAQHREQLFETPPSIQDMQARLPAALDAAAAHDLLLANTPAGSALLSDPETREQHAKIKVLKGNKVDGRVLACWAALAVKTDVGTISNPTGGPAPGKTTEKTTEKTTGRGSMGRSSIDVVQTLLKLSSAAPQPDEETSMETSSSLSSSSTTSTTSTTSASSSSSSSSLSPSTSSAVSSSSHAVQPWVKAMASVEEAALLLRCCDMLHDMTPLAVDLQWLAGPGNTHKDEEEHMFWSMMSTDIHPTQQVTVRAKLEKLGGPCAPLLLGSTHLTAPTRGQLPFVIKQEEPFVIKQEQGEDEEDDPQQGGVEGDIEGNEEWELGVSQEDAFAMAVEFRAYKKIVLWEAVGALLDNMSE